MGIRLHEGGGYPGEGPGSRSGRTPKPHDAFDSTLGYPGEGPPADTAATRRDRRRPLQGQPPPRVRQRPTETWLRLLTQNVNGFHATRRAGTGTAADDSDDEPLGDGWDLRADADSRLRAAMQVMRDRYAAVIWQETHTSRKEMNAIRGMIKRVHGYESFGTPGKRTHTGRHTRGVLVAWDPSVLICEDQEVLLHHRVVRVRLRALGDGSVFDLVGSYMPVQSDPAEDIDEAWDCIAESATAPDVLIGADFNVSVAATSGAAAAWLHDVIDDHELTHHGLDEATYERGDVATNIDYWLAGKHVAERVRVDGAEAKMSDHWGVALRYAVHERGVGGCGPSREAGPNLSRLQEEDWLAYSRELIGPATVEALHEAGEDSVERVKVRQSAMIATAEKLIGTRKEARARDAKRAGGRAMSAEVKLRGDVARWRALRAMIEVSDGRCRRGRGRNRMSRVSELAEIISQNLHPHEERERMLEVCDTKLTAACGALDAYNTKAGDGLLEQMDEAVRQSEGGAQIGMFCVVREAMGKDGRRRAKEADPMWMQESRAQQAPRGPAPAKLSAMYRAEVGRQWRVVPGDRPPPGGKEIVGERAHTLATALRGGVRTLSDATLTAADCLGKLTRDHYVRVDNVYLQLDAVEYGPPILDEVAQQTTYINRQRACFPETAAHLMDLVGLTAPTTTDSVTPPLPPVTDMADGGSGAAWVDSLCTFAHFKAGLAKIKIDTGVGVDRWSAYLLRKAPDDVQRGYWRDLTRCIAQHRFPESFTNWNCMLAMKPGEDPYDLSRRRDLWLMPHGQKLTMRLLQTEYDRAADEVVPGGQAGFTRRRGAPEQMLMMRGPQRALHGSAHTMPTRVYRLGHRVFVNFEIDAHLREKYRS